MPKSFFRLYINNYMSFLLLQQTDLKSGDLNSVPKGAHDLWSELKESLIKRPVLQGCYNPRRQTVCNCCDNTSSTNVSEGH